jgi:predicted NAD/FAD-binding protein
LLAKINRFNAEAVAALSDPRYATHTVREYVETRHYGKDFLDLFLLPMSSAVWSTPPDAMLDFPAMTLLRFFHNHGFLGLHTQHPWRTVTAGAQSYVRKMSEPWRSRIALGRKAVRVSRDIGKARVTTADGTELVFDKVILASHADQSLRMLADPTPEETRLLRGFQYQHNTTTLHTDASFMPKTRRCWASWNYQIAKDAEGRIQPSTHYWMNSLQGVSRNENYFVSLNAHDRIAPEKVLRRIDYEHPVFSLGAIRAQSELPSLNTISRDQSIYYCGSYFKYGFHEDAFTSGLDCARAITGEAIWS